MSPRHSPCSAPDPETGLEPGPQHLPNMVLADQNLRGHHLPADPSDGFWGMSFGDTICPRAGLKADPAQDPGAMLMPVTIGPRPDSPGLRSSHLALRDALFVAGNPGARRCRNLADAQEHPELIASPGG